MHVIVRTKHEQRYWMSFLFRKRDGLVSRARALALERRQDRDVAYMRRPDVMDKPIDIAGPVMCLCHSNHWHLWALVQPYIRVFINMRFPYLLQTSLNHGQLA
jgi:hypothetical protein